MRRCELGVWMYTGSPTSLRPDNHRGMEARIQRESFLTDLGEFTPHEFASQIAASRDLTCCPETNSWRATENGDRSLRPKSYSDLFGKRGTGQA
jgi:hypothetical protein